MQCDVINVIAEVWLNIMWAQMAWLILWRRKVRQSCECVWEMLFLKASNTHCYQSNNTWVLAQTSFWKMWHKKKTQIIYENIWANRNADYSRNGSTLNFTAHKYPVILILYGVLKCLIIRCCYVHDLLSFYIYNLELFNVHTFQWTNLDILFCSHSMSWFFFFFFGIQDEQRIRDQRGWVLSSWDNH